MVDQLGLSLRETLVGSELPTLIHELGEIGVDSLLEDGLLKEVPIFGTVLALGKTAGSFRDYLFTRKLLRFLRSVADLDPEERVSMVNRLEKEPGFGAYAGERLIDLLSRLDDEAKPRLVGKALKLYAKCQITAEQLQRINYALERFLLCDLRLLREFCATGAKPRPTDDDPVTANFINAGLGHVSSGYGGGGVHPTQTAALLLRVVEADEPDGLTGG